MPSQAGANVRAAAIDLPLAFEPNVGQADARVRFVARGNGCGLLLSPGEAVLVLRSRQEPESPLRHPDECSLRPDEDRGGPPVVIRMTFAGGNPEPELVTEGCLEGVSNYFLGNDPSRWRRSVPHWKAVRYRNVYPGIDALFYGSHGDLEYDLVVAPGADPEEIHIAFSGARDGVVTPEGDLSLRTCDGAQILSRRPVVYQERGEARASIECGYAIEISRTAQDVVDVAYCVGDHDVSRPLFIDPILAYSSYWGGNDYDGAFDVKTDSSGNAYVIGYTSSTSFPVASPYQATLAGMTDVFVSKLDPSGSTLLYSTYLGGSSQDSCHAGAIDGSGNICLAGSTESYDFPMASPLQATKGGAGDVFMSKLDPTGSVLLFSTYLGGDADDWASDVKVDGAGLWHVAGETHSSNFPLANALDPTLGGWSDAFVAEVDTAASSLVYSTYLGGSTDEGAHGLAVDSAGATYVSGFTWSTDFPTVSGVQPSFGGGNADGFVAKISPWGSILQYSTFLGGGSLDGVRAIDVDASGSAVVTGVTLSDDFPVRLPLQSYGGDDDAFVSRLAPSGSAFIFSTYLGAGDDDEGFSIAYDASNDVLIAGHTYSTGFPTVNPVQADLGGMSDGFVTRIAASGSSLLFSTFLGGSLWDQVGGTAVHGESIWLVGGTTSPDFPTQNALQPSYGGGWIDGFVAKIDFCGPLVLSPPFLANGVVGASYSETISVSGGTPPYAFALTSGTLPPGLSIDTSTGTIAGTPGASGLYPFTVQATDAQPCTGGRAYTLVVDPGGCPSITVSPPTLPGGVAGSSYAQTLTAMGGMSPYTFVKTGGILPPGLSLSSYGDVSGTPGLSGVFTFRATAIDASGCTGSGTYDLTVSCPALTISPPALPDGMAGGGYSQTLSVPGGVPPYAFRLAAGSLPPGLTLSGSGLINGTPTTPGTSSFTIMATDASACSASAAYSVRIGYRVDFVVGEGLGPTNGNQVKVYYGWGWPAGVAFLAYGAGQWGVNVASADVNGASDEILTAPGPGAVYGPQIRAFDRLGNGMGKVNFYAYGTLKYGSNVAGGDVDAEGAYAEILSGAGPGAVFGPHVRGWNFDNATLTAISKVNFNAYGTLRYGVNVAAGDVDGDGRAEIATGAGPGAVFSPQVRGFNYDGVTLAQIGKINFAAWTATAFGANVSCGDVEADGYEEIAAVKGPGSTLTADFAGFDYDASSLTRITGYDITDAYNSYQFGGRLGMGNVTASLIGDGNAELLTGPGRDPAADAELRAYRFASGTQTQIVSFTPFAGTYGLNVAGGALGY